MQLLLLSSINSSVTCRPECRQQFNSLRHAASPSSAVLRIADCILKKLSFLMSSLRIGGGRRSGCARNSVQKSNVNYIAQCVHFCVKHVGLNIVVFLVMFRLHQIISWRAHRLVTMWSAQQRHCWITLGYLCTTP